MAELSMTRRQMVLAGIGLTVSGCTQRAVSIVDRPGPPWPVIGVRPRVLREVDVGSSQLPAPEPKGKTLVAISRSAWAKSGPILRRLRPMGKVGRITVHHEGWKPFWHNDFNRTATRLEAIRKSHLDRLGAGDIGYHWIIDRAGKVYGGRDPGFQGAHVRGHNENNLGVMVLGNFDKQSPTDAQYRALHATLGTLMQKYSISSQSVYTHQELVPTLCPGVALQQHMEHVVRRGVIG